MGLDLKWEDIVCCSLTGVVAVNGEESLETAIPEYCPDVARVVDAAGQLQIREKSVSDGKVIIRGGVKVTVLYTSEESAGLRSLSISVPFTAQTDDKRLEGCRHICADGRLLLCEVKAITARKLYVRVMPELMLTGFAQQRRRLCRDAEGDFLRLRHREAQLRLLSAVEEREFAFAREVMPEDTKPRPEEVLLDRLTLQTPSCQRVGSKLAIKGEAKLCVMYRAEDRQLAHYETVLPLSQILDGMAWEEDGDFAVEIRLKEWEVRLVKSEVGGGFGVSAKIEVMVYIGQQRHIRWVEDLYSTRYQSRLQHETVTVPVNHRRQLQQEMALQQLEFGRGDGFAELISADCGQVSMSGEDGQTRLDTTLRMKILYLDETGTPISTERSAEVETVVPSAPDQVRAACGAPQMHMTGSRCELQIPIEFHMCADERLEIRTVSSAELLEESDRGQKPSLVLRRLMPEETLWDLAKQYQSDEQAIREANKLGEDTVPDGMLMIPKVR